MEEVVDVDPSYHHVTSTTTVSNSVIMRLPTEILVSIGDIQKRHLNPGQLIESTKVCSYWNLLFDERSTVNALLRLLPDLCAYLPKNDVWRLRLVNTKISATLSRMLDYAIGNYGDGTDAENPPLPLRWRVIPTLKVNAETFAFNKNHAARLTSLLSDIERAGRLQHPQRLWCPISTSVLCKSLDVTIFFGGDDDEIKNPAPIIDFLRTHGHVVSDLRLRVTDNSVGETRASIQHLMELFQNVRRLELFGTVVVDDPEAAREFDVVVWNQTVEPDPPKMYQPLTLQKLQHLLLRSKFNFRRRGRWSTSLHLSRVFGLVFHSQFQNIRSFATTDLEGARFTHYHMMPRNISSLELCLRADWTTQLRLLRLMSLRRLTLRFVLWNYNGVIEQEFERLPPAEVLRFLGQGNNAIIKKSLEFLRFEFLLDGSERPEYEFFRHGLFPSSSSNPPLEFPRLSTLVIKNGFLAKGFGGGGGGGGLATGMMMPNLKVIRMEFLQWVYTATGLSNQWGSCSSEIWDRVPSLETFTTVMVEEEGEEDGDESTWMYSRTTRDQWEWKKSSSSSRTRTTLSSPWLLGILTILLLSSLLILSSSLNNDSAASAQPPPPTEDETRLSSIRGDRIILRSWRWEEYEDDGCWIRYDRFEENERDYSAEVETTHYLRCVCGGTISWAFESRSYPNYPWPEHHFSCGDNLSYHYRK